MVNYNNASIHMIYTTTTRHYPLPDYTPRYTTAGYSQTYFQINIYIYFIIY